MGIFFIILESHKTLNMKTFIKALPVFLIFFSIGRFIKYDFTFDSIVIATATIGILGTIFLFFNERKDSKTE
ncbi:hypothetical protein C8J95_10980 [Elizabethkingia sp. YR214]|nr:hypothetical protein C8J95_10980 [Elizabethkingia sp. YR214]